MAKFLLEWREEEVTDEEVRQLFQPLYADLGPDTFYRKRPLLAHYTTMQTLQKILTNNELWFANHLFMNDLEEAWHSRRQQARGREQGNHSRM